MVGAQTAFGASSAMASTALAAQKASETPPASTSKQLHPYREQEGSKARRFTSRWKSSDAVPSPELGFSRKSGSNGGGSRHAANRWGFQRNHCEGARQHQTPAARPGSWVSTVASWRESYKLCLRFMLVL